MRLVKQKLMEMWLARDKDETLWLFTYKPRKGEEEWESTNFYNKNFTCMILNGSLFPEVKWSDEEPTKLKLEIVK